MDNFTDKGREIVDRTLSEATKFSSSYIGSEHLLLAILSVDGTVAKDVLDEFGISYAAVNDMIEKFEKKDNIIISDAGDMTPRLRKIIENAGIISRQMGHTTAGSEHLLASVLDEPDCVASVIVRSIEPDVYKIRQRLFVLDEKLSERSREGGKAQCEMLTKYSVNLSDKAKKNEIDPVIGREEETLRTMRILCRRIKNNPCLVGEPGVGKTAIVEGLAVKIENGDVPPPLLGKKIFTVDLSLMIAGAKFRGEFEERLKKIIDEAEEDSDIILFIDEIHTIIGAGSAEGAMDAANIIKPALARGNFRLIGATTYSEYRKYIEKDAALERRFQKVDIKEPSVSDTVGIINGIKSRYEDYHQTAIPPEIVDYAVLLSCRFIKGRFLPDKAIDLIDEGCAGAAISGREKVEKYDIDEALELMTGIELSGLSQNEFEKMGDRLKSQTAGQDRAIDEVILRLEATMGESRESGRTLGSFIFTGPSGVGKTSLALSLGRELFGEGGVIRLDMSEYSESHSVARLIGAPPGYIGHGNGGILTEKVAKRPRCLILFDEIEKAHRDIYNILLGILDGGEMTDSAGKTVDFTGCIIILTANFSNKEKSLGFVQDAKTSDNRSALRGVLPSELLSRFDSVVEFYPLYGENMVKAVRIMLCEYKKRLEKISISFDFDDAAAVYFAENTVSGDARDAKRLISRELDTKIPQGKTGKIILSLQNGKPTLSFSD